MLLANGHFAGVTPAIFVMFVDFRGSRSKVPCFLWAECNIRIFANFRQNHLFSAGDKTNVFQNGRFDNPDFGGLKKSPRKYPEKSNISQNRFFFPGIFRLSRVYSGTFPEDPYPPSLGGEIHPPNLGGEPSKIPCFTVFFQACHPNSGGEIITPKFGGYGSSGDFFADPPKDSF